MKSLYLKYRPKDFNEVIGQDIVKKILINSVINDKVGHAYIFNGIRGTGKTTLARIFSKSINCEFKINNYNPCNKCKSCIEIDNATNFDVIEIDAASNNGIEEIREINEKAKYSTGNLKYKVFIIDEFHMLSKSAFNALLKTLEEPPRNTVFLLATTEMYKIPETIISRSIILNLEQIKRKDMIQLLERILSQEKIKFDENILDYIVSLAKGSARDSISILEHSLLYSNELKFNEFLRINGIIEFNVIDKIIDGYINFNSLILNEENFNYKNLLNLFIEILTNRIIKSNKTNLKLLEKLLDIKISTGDFEIIRSLFIKTLNENFNEFKVKKISEYLNGQLFFKVIHNSDSNVLNDAIEKYNAYLSHSNNDFIESGKIVEADDKILVIEFIDKNKYSEFKNKEFDFQFLKNIEEVFGEKKFLAPVLKESWDKIVDMYNKNPSNGKYDVDFSRIRNFEN